MRERKMCVLLCVTFLLTATMAFSAMDVLLSANDWPRKTNNRYEWGDTSTYFSDIFSKFTNAGRNDTNGRFGYGAVDWNFDGDVGDESGEGQSDVYNASVIYYAGTGDYRIDWGEVRFAQTFNLSNPYGWMRHYDTSYFSPTADPTTSGVCADDGDGIANAADFDRALGGPTKGLFRGVPESESYTGGVGYYNPKHFYMDNTTSVEGGIPLNATINRILWSTGIGTGPYTGSYGSQERGVRSIADDKTVAIVHNQPPIPQMNVACTDNAWGSHSNGTSYYERTVARLNMGYLTNSAPDEFAINPPPSFPGSVDIVGLHQLPNNYPTDRFGVTGVFLIDEPGTDNDQYLYHGEGDPDPLINSFIADMRAGRGYVWFTFQAYRYYADAWPQNDTHAVWWNPVRSVRSTGTMLIAVGDSATAEDWVLYK